MGVIKQGILGGISGRVCNVVGSSWKGIAVLKSLPLSVANPKTAGQQAQRGAMTQIVAASRSLMASLIQTYWNPVAVKMSGYNYFVKENIATFTTSGFTTFADFFATRGTLLGAALTSAVADASDSNITLGWTDNAGSSDALGTDIAVGVAYNATKDYWVVSDGSDTRADESIVMADTQVEASDDMYCYLGFARPNYSKIADSTYLQATVQA